MTLELLQEAPSNISHLPTIPGGVLHLPAIPVGVPHPTTPFPILQDSYDYYLSNNSDPAIDGYNCSQGGPLCTNELVVDDPNDFSYPWKVSSEGAKWAGIKSNREQETSLVCYPGQVSGDGCR